MTNTQKIKYLKHCYTEWKVTLPFMKHKTLDQDNNVRLLSHVFHEEQHRVLKVRPTRALTKQLDIA